MKLILLKVALLLLCYVEFSCGAGKNRVKRYLVFPLGGSYKLVIGIGIPIKIGTKQSMAIGWNFQAQYQVPTNITQLQEYPPDYVNSKSISKRESRTSDRMVVYTAIEEMLNKENYNGRECILRSICENAKDNLFHEDNGLYGELLHIVFTPTYGDGMVDDDLNPIYLEAQKAGEYGVECDTLYPRCGMDSGFLGLFSILEDKFE